METASENTQSPSKMAKIISNKPFLISIAVLGIYALIGFLLVPYVLKGQIEGYVKDELGRQLTVEKVYINPFALTVELSGVSLQEADGTHLLSFKRFFTNFELMSLFRRAWTFKEIALDRPDLSIKLESDGGMNWGRLILDASKKEEIEKSPPEDKDTDKNPPRVFFNNIKVTDGQLLFADHSDTTPAEVQLNPIHFEINNLSTIPDREGEHTVSIALPKGGLLKWAGTTSLVPFESKGALALTGFKESIAWLFLQDELNLTQPEGTTDLSLRYLISKRDGVFQFLIDNVAATIAGLRLVLKGAAEEQVLAMDRIEIKDGRFDLAKNSYTIGHIGLSDGNVLLKLDQAGAFNLNKVMATRQEKEKKKDVQPSEKLKKSSPFNLMLEMIDFSKVALRYVDDTRQSPMDVKARRVDLSLSLNVATGPTTTKTVLDEIVLSIGDVSLHQAGEENPLVSLPETKISAGPLDFAEHRVVIGDVALSQGEVALWLDKEGVFNFSRFKGRKTDGSSTQQPADSNDTDTAGQKPWSFELANAKLEGFNLSFTDRKIGPKPLYHLTNIHIGLDGFKNDPKTDFNYDLSLDVKQGGHLAAKGRANAFKPSIKSDIELAALALSPLESYLQSVAKINLDSGNVSIKGSFEYGSDPPDAMAFNGQVGVEELDLTLPKTQETLLSWKKLETRGLRYSTAPAGLAIKEVVLSKPTGKLVIRKDKSINFSDVFVKSEARAKETSDSNPLPIEIKKVSIDGGKLDFADLSLIFPFHVDIHRLSGAMTGLSSNPKNKASIDLKGRVQKYGTVSIEGDLQPFDIRKYFDVGMSFENLEMTELTPYSAEFAGRKISSGKLFLDLDYLIENSQLKAENNLLLDYFILGDSVKNKKAVALPLDLAVALLKDANDRIDIGLPITGDLKDPKFKYGHLIWKAIVNLITKVVAAPFKALGALVGLDDEKLDAVVFEAGRSDLPPPEMEKLSRLADALIKRPQLTLEIQGCYDEKADGNIIKDNSVKRELAKRMGIEETPGESASPLDFSDETVQKTLLAMSRERVPSKKIEALEESFSTSDQPKKTTPKTTENQTEKKPAGVDLVGFYSKLFEELVGLEPLNEAALGGLSDQRAQAIIDDLVQVNGLSPDRAQIIDSGKSAGVDKGQVACKLNLAVSRQAVK